MTTTQRARALTARFLHPTVVAQGISATAALLLAVVASRALPTVDYAAYYAIAAAWALANAVVGTRIGTRVAADAARQGVVQFVLAKELPYVLVGSAVIFAYVSSISTPSIAATATMGGLSFVTLEISQSETIGSAAFGRYTAVAAIRGVGPVALSGAWWALSGELGLQELLLSFIISNLLASLVWPSRWSRSPSANSRSAGLVGLVNLSLWVVASGDKIMLQELGTAYQLAVYGLAYGMLDRLYRAAANVLVAKNLGKSFTGTYRRLNWRYLLVLGVLSVFIAPVTRTLCSVVSDQQYVPSWSMTFGICCAVFLLVVSSSVMIDAIGQGMTGAATACAVAIAGANIALNIWLIPHFGATASAWLSAAAYAAWLVSLTLAYRHRATPEGATT